MLGRLVFLVYAPKTSASRVDRRNLATLICRTIENVKSHVHSSDILKQMYTLTRVKIGQIARRRKSKALRRRQSGTAKGSKTSTLRQ
jgi:hypothetical protein